MTQLVVSIMRRVIITIIIAWLRFSWVFSGPIPCILSCHPGPNCKKPSCSCPSGYSKHPVLPRLCNPICSKICINGSCIKPEVCGCKRNFILNPSNKYECISKCHASCLNGTCSPYDNCICNDGFELDKTNKFKCIPKCLNECINGYCSAPNICSCNEGFSLDDNERFKCLPKCAEICKNGKCAFNEKCLCEKGYVLDPFDNHKCVPEFKPNINVISHKDLQVAISNGNEMEIILLNETQEVNKDEGILKVDGNKLCNMSCINGTCSSDDSCICNDGFELDKYNKFICNPKCLKECINGYCSDPNVCSCYEGFMLDEDDNERFKCLPKCGEVCKNGKCTFSEKCLCEEGYVLDPLDIHKCIPEFKPNINVIHHEDLQIKNGNKNEMKIILSNEKGIEILKVDGNKLCNMSCINGTCSSNDTCICNDGFELDKFNKFICNPKCLKECINGYCSDPYICSCYEGFILKEDDDERFKCLPKCGEVCKNGKCTFSEKCLCEEGYVLDPLDIHKCIPEFKPNINVIHHEDLQIKNGNKNEMKIILSNEKGIEILKVDGNKLCNMSCINGTCSSNDICICNDGFELDKFNKFICNPKCLTECINGYCSDPYVCSCYEGFMLDEDDNERFKCLPKCGEVCKNGKCTFSEKCLCEEGYVLDPLDIHKCIPEFKPNINVIHHEDLQVKNGNKNEMKIILSNEKGIEILKVDGNKLCNMSCINGTCSSNDICICNDGFELDKFNKFICNPKCLTECINGYCSDPYVCSCYEGFILEEDDDERFKCLPKCGEVCKNGKCTFSEKCLCEEGYVLDPFDIHKCVPKFEPNIHLISHTQLEIQIEKGHDMIQIKKEEDIESIDDTQDRKVVEDERDTKTTKDSNDIRTTEDSKDIKITENSEEKRNVENAEDKVVDVEDRRNREDSKDIKTTEDKKYVDDKIVEDAEDTKTTKESKDIKITQDMEDKRIVKDIEDIKSIEDRDIVEDEENTKIAEDSKITKTTKDVDDKNVINLANDTKIKENTSSSFHRVVLHETYIKDQVGNPLVYPIEDPVKNPIEDSFRNPVEDPISDLYADSFQDSEFRNETKKEIIKESSKGVGNNESQQTISTIINDEDTNLNTFSFAQHQPTESSRDVSSPTNQEFSQKETNSLKINQEVTTEQTLNLNDFKNRTENNPTETCNKGYILSPTNSCIPHCSSPCINSYCSGPDLCTCNENFVPSINSKYRCVSKCEKKECAEAKCTEHGCVCPEGFSRDSKDPFRCNKHEKLPPCERECANGMCAGRDLCRCKPGYERDPKNDSSCLPSCRVDCINGKCTERGVCECEDNFEFDVKTKSCELKGKSLLKSKGGRIRIYGESLIFVVMVVTVIWW